jgi:hypothetical protein
LAAEIAVEHRGPIAGRLAIRIGIAVEILVQVPQAFINTAVDLNLQSLISYLDEIRLSASVPSSLIGDGQTRGVDGVGWPGVGVLRLDDVSIVHSARRGRGAVTEVPDVGYVGSLLVGGSFESDDGSAPGVMWDEGIGGHPGNGLDGDRTRRQGHGDQYRETDHNENGQQRSPCLELEHCELSFPPRESPARKHTSSLGIASTSVRRQL